MFGITLLVISILFLQAKSDVQILHSYESSTTEKNSLISLTKSDLDMPLSTNSYELVTSKFQNKSYFVKNYVKL